VQITLYNNTVVIQDCTTQTVPKKINFTDLIGQPTWQKLQTIQVTCVLRADIGCGDFVSLPNTPGITTPGSYSQAFSTPGVTTSSPKQGTVFTGTYQVNAVRHVGNSRSPLAAGWVTVLDLVLRPTPTNTVASYPVIYNGSNTYSFTLPGQT
jgi:hypothetical protein